MSSSPVSYKFISDCTLKMLFTQQRRESHEVSRRQSSCHALRGIFQGKPYTHFRTLWVGAVRIQGYEPQKSNTEKLTMSIKTSEHQRQVSALDCETQSLGDCHQKPKLEKNLVACVLQSLVVEGLTCCGQSFIFIAQLPRG